MAPALVRAAVHGRVEAARLLLTERGAGESREARALQSSMSATASGTMPKSAVSTVRLCLMQLSRGHLKPARNLLHEFGEVGVRRERRQIEASLPRRALADDVGDAEELDPSRVRVGVAREAALRLDGVSLSLYGHRTAHSGPRGIIPSSPIRPSAPPPAACVCLHPTSPGSATSNSLLHTPLSELFFHLVIVYTLHETALFAYFGSTISKSFLT